jgi:hypothetical protein
MPRPDPNEKLTFVMTRQQAADLGSILAVGLFALRNPDYVRPSFDSSSTLIRAGANLARCEKMHDFLTDSEAPNRCDQELNNMAILCQRFANETFKLHANEIDIEGLLFKETM